MAERAETRSLRCVVVTPERALLDEAADFVALPMFDGELGVAPGRAALIGRLGCGELRIKHAGTVAHYYVDGGFAQVRANVVTVLTTKACKTSRHRCRRGPQVTRSGRQPDPRHPKHGPPSTHRARREFPEPNFVSRAKPDVLFAHFARPPFSIDEPRARWVLMPDWLLVSSPVHDLRTLAVANSPLAPVLGGEGRG